MKIKSGGSKRKSALSIRKPSPPGIFRGKTAVECGTGLKKYPVNEIHPVPVVSGGSRRDFSFLPTLIAAGHEQGPKPVWTGEYPK
jgi:hypothetical protein